MDQQVYRKRIVFWLRFSGWLCVLPALVWLKLAQAAPSGGYAALFWGELVVITLFASYVLATANNARWLRPKNIFNLMVIALIFISFIDIIPLYLAYSACRKLNGS